MIISVTLNILLQSLHLLISTAMEALPHTLWCESCPLFFRPLNIAYKTGEAGMDLGGGASPHQNIHALFCFQVFIISIQLFSKILKNVGKNGISWKGPQKCSQFFKFLTKYSASLREVDFNKFLGLNYIDSAVFWWIISK